MKIMDANAGLAFVKSQQGIVEREALDTDFSHIIYPDIVPVDTSGNPWAATATYISGEGTGQAEWFDGSAHDMPYADRNVEVKQTPIHLAAIGYRYTMEEVQQASMLGINLNADKATAARRAYEEKAQQVAFDGDANKAYNGLINQGSSNFTHETAAVDFTDLTTNAKQRGVLAALRSGIRATGKGLNPTADTMLVDPTVADAWQDAYMTNDGLTTFWDHVSANGGPNGGAIDIRIVPGLKEAASGNKQRIVIYQRDPSVLKMHIPMPHRFLPAWQRSALGFEVPGIFRIGGLNVRRKQDFVYLDSTA